MQHIYKFMGYENPADFVDTLMRAIIVETFPRSAPIRVNAVGRREYMHGPLTISLACDAAIQGNIPILDIQALDMSIYDGVHTLTCATPDAMLLMPELIPIAASARLALRPVHTVPLTIFFSDFPVSSPMELSHVATVSFTDRRYHNIDRVTIDVRGVTDTMIAYLEERIEFDDTPSLDGMSAVEIVGCFEIMAILGVAGARF